MFEELLLDFDIRGVFDLSPGSGCLAEAALRLGICYVGVTTKAAHAKWLGNVIDRVAMSHVVTPGRPCYLKDLAGDVQAHFRSHAGRVAGKCGHGGRGSGGAHAGELVDRRKPCWRDRDLCGVTLGVGPSER